MKLSASKSIFIYLLESDRQPYRMLRSVMVDSLLDRHSEESRFDPWFATFAHPTNTYGKGAMPERIDYLMYRCSPNIKMRTYDFKLPMLMGKDASGRPMSVSDHESLHAEFIVEMEPEEQTRAVSSENKYPPRYTNRRNYYPTDRSGVSYDDLLALEEEDESLYIQDDYSDYEIYKTATKNNNNLETKHTSRLPGRDRVVGLSDNDQTYSTLKEPKATTHSTEFLENMKFDKYAQVLYLLNLTSDTTIENFESNKIQSAIDKNGDEDY